MTATAGQPDRRLSLFWTFAFPGQKGEIVPVAANRPAAAPRGKPLDTAPAPNNAATAAAAAAAPSDTTSHVLPARRCKG